MQSRFDNARGSLYWLQPGRTAKTGNAGASSGVHIGVKEGWMGGCMGGCRGRGGRTGGCTGKCTRVSGHKQRVDT